MAILSSRQRQIFDYVVRRIAAGLAPTQAEIAVEFGMHQVSARQHLKALEAKGYVDLGSRQFARGIRVLHQAAALPASTQLPLIGRIAAGSPITSGENVQEWIDVGTKAFGPRADCLFRVQGHSMQRVGVLDRDLVAVQFDPDPPAGGIIAAVLPDPVTNDLVWTLKRYKRLQGVIVLLSENDDQEAYPPQRYPLDSGLQVVGRYVGLIRQRHDR